MDSRSDLLIRQLCAQVLQTTDEKETKELLQQLQQQIRLHISGMRDTAATEIPKLFRVDDSDLALLP